MTPNFYWRFGLGGLYTTSQSCGALKVLFVYKFYEEPLNMILTEAFTLYMTSTINWLSFGSNPNFGWDRRFLFLLLLLLLLFSIILHLVYIRLGYPQLFIVTTGQMQSNMRSTLMFCYEYLKHDLIRLISAKLRNIRDFGTKLFMSWLKLWLFSVFTCMW